MPTSDDGQGRQRAYREDAGNVPTHSPMLSLQATGRMFHGVSP
ncbi:hypothetical protein QF205_15010 [Luteimonas composti]|uniref:Uncharacterized protein n=1 Tax=Luteimonas composti TaxID=398257 RepID=A0ABT6MUQ2_9GAMM|nr:hypothetical protein [Luteimonas composti]MDH7454369.1 hypothetical protein [Luteimonas composti]